MDICIFYVGSTSFFYVCLVAVLQQMLHDCSKMVKHWLRFDWFDCILQLYLQNCSRTNRGKGGGCHTEYIFSNSISQLFLCNQAASVVTSLIYSKLPQVCPNLVEHFFFNNHLFEQLGTVKDFQSSLLFFLTVNFHFLFFFSNFSFSWSTPLVALALQGTFTFLIIRGVPFMSFLDQPVLDQNYGKWRSAFSL